MPDDSGRRSLETSGWSTLSRDPLEFPQTLMQEPDHAPESGELQASPPTPPVVVRLDAEVEFVDVEIAGVRIVRARHLGTGQSFQFGASEVYVAQLLDGRRSVTEVFEQAQADGLDWTPQEIAEFVALLVRQRIALTSDQPSKVAPAPPLTAESLPAESSPTASPIVSPVQAQPAPRAPRKPWPHVPLQPIVGGALRACSWLISVRLPLIAASPIVDRLVPIVRPACGSVGASLAMLLIVSASVVMVTHHAELLLELRRVFDSPMWLALLIIWAVLKACHELGHALAAGLHGVRVGRAGLMFFMFAPMAYVDVTDAWSLPRRWPRVQIALAGVLVECLIAAVAVWVWWWMPGGLVAHLAAQVFFLAGPASLVVNANPLLRLDGYFVVSDLTDIPNLRSQGRSLVSGWLQRRLFGITSPPSNLHGWRRVFAAVHAVAAMMFQIGWMTGLIIAIAWWAGPLGVATASAAVLLWVLVPTLRWFVGAWNWTSGEPTFRVQSHRRRLVWSLVTGLLIVHFFVTLPSPFCLHVPVVVRFADDQLIRSPIDGFLRRVAVSTGQQVHAGQWLMEFEDEEDRLARDEIAAQLAAEEILWQQHQQKGALGLADASRRKSETLRRRWQELDARLQSLRVTATGAGTVLTPNVHELQGRFIRQGETLVHLGTLVRKELLISIGEDQVDAYSAAVLRGDPIDVFFRGGRRIKLVPVPMRPQATRRVPHPAMPASVGGPLAVSPAMRADADEPYELLRPRFEGVLPIATATADGVRCGEVGKLAVQDRRSLIDRFWQWMMHPSAQP